MKRHYHQLRPMLMSLLVCQALAGTTFAGEADSPLPEIRLTGITSVLGQPRALLVVSGSASTERSHMLKIGETEGGVELVDLDEKAKEVKVRCQGRIVTVRMQAAPSIMAPAAGLKAPESPPPISSFPMPAALPTHQNPQPPVVEAEGQNGGNMVVIGRRNRGQSPNSAPAQMQNPQSSQTPLPYWQPVAKNQQAPTPQPVPVKFNPTPTPPPVPIPDPVPIIPPERYKYPPLPPTSITPTPVPPPSRPR